MNGVERDDSPNLFITKTYFSRLDPNPVGDPQTPWEGEFGVDRERVRVY
jgi:hypothetical protein